MFSSINVVCIIALFILAAIVNHSAYMDERKNRLFLLAILSNILILSGYLGRDYAESHNNIFLSYLSNLIIYNNGMLCAFFLLISSMKVGSVSFIIAVILEAVGFTVATSSPWTKLSFIIDSNGIYTRGNGYWITMLIGMIMLCIWIYRLLLIYKHVEFKKRLYIILLACFEIIIIFLQGKDSQLKIIYIGSSFVLAIYYAFIMEVDGRYDPMTGVFSKRYYYIATEYLSKEDDYIVFMMDGNNLKIINDTYGHNAGDLAIETIGQTVLKLIGPYSQIFRLGGDEFIGFSTELDEKAMQALMDKVDDRLKEQSLKLGFAISTAKGFTVHKSGEDYTDTVKRADDIMYDNKSRMKAQK